MYLVFVITMLCCLSFLFCCWTPLPSEEEESVNVSHNATGEQHFKRSSEDLSVKSSLPFWFSSLLQKKACDECFLERREAHLCTLGSSLRNCFNPSFMCVSVISWPSNQQEHTERFSPPEGEMVLVDPVQFCLLHLLLPKFSLHVSQPPAEESPFTRVHSFSV